MKKMNIVRNTNTEGTEAYRERSRIGSINHRIWSVIAPMLFIAFGLFGVNENAWGYAASKLTVKVSGQGQVAVTTSSTQPGSSSYSSTFPSDDQSDWGVFSTHTYYVWVKPNEGYRCTGVSDCSWNNAGYYTISITGRTSQVKKEVTATFVGNSYTISFDGNGNTSGLMSDQSGFVYGTAKTLSTNTFGRAYTVTYDANGGSCGTSSATATYTFNGWKSSNGTSYTNKASVSTFSPAPDHNSTVTLTAQWTSASVTLPSVTNGTKEFLGWYDENGKYIGKKEASYTPTENIKLIAHWAAKKEPKFAGEGKALTLGNTYSGFSFDFTTAATPSSSTSAKFHYIITEQKVEGNSAGTPYPEQVIIFDGTTITAVNKGTAKIKFVQLEDEANNIAAGESSEYEFTVTKFTPTFTWNAQTYYFNNTYANIFSSTNHDTEITCGTSNSSAAEMFAGSNNYQKTLKTFNDSSATITISQAENYYWEPKSATYKVASNKVSNHVAFDYTESMFNNTGITIAKEAAMSTQWKDGYVFLQSSGFNWDDKYIIIKFEGIPDKLYYKISTDNVTATDPEWYIQENSTNSFSNAAKKNEETRNNATWSGERSLQLSPTSRYVKICYSGNFAACIKDIRITELQYFKTETTSLDFASNQLNHAPAVQTFDVEHANAGYQTIVTAPAHYQVSLDGTNFASSVTYSDNSTAKTGGDKIGTFKVYVKYLADDEGTHNSNVVVSNNLRANISVSVKGITRGKLETHIEYIGETSYNVDTTNLAATGLFRVVDENGAVVANPVITLSSNNASVIAIEGNTAIDPLCGGSSTITATYAGDGTYSGSTKEQSITINRLEDEVSFDNAYASMVVGEELDITNWTSALSGTNITITSIYQDILKVENGKVIALKKGSGRLRADSEGNCIYNPGRSFLDITVRKPEDPCGSSLLYYSNTVKCGAYSHTASSPKELTLYDGPKDKLTFKAWKYSWATTQEEYLVLQDKNGNELHKFTYSVGDLPSDEPESANFEIDLENYQNVAKIVMYGEGSLNKYFSQIRVTQKAYLTASTSAVTMSTVKACETATGQFTVSYSDLSRIHLTQTNNDFTYEVWDGDTKLDDFHNDCKAYGTYTIKFFYTPQSKGAYSNTVTISASGKEQMITLSGTANKPDREIVWDIDLANTVSATQSLDLTAYAQTACENPAGSVYYTYTSDTDGAATIDGSHITFNKASTVTVTAHTVTSDMYEDADAVSKVWTVGKVGTQMRTLPTITSAITYGDNSFVVVAANDWIAEDVLNNDEIQGHINYVSPASFAAAGAQDLIFNFTPDNIATYDVCQFTVPVTVLQKTSVATPSAANIVYGQKVIASLLSNVGTDGTWAWKEADRETVLPAGKHTLNVDFTPDNSNYTTIENVAVELTVEKATTTASANAIALTYGETPDSKVLSTASAAVEGEWSWNDDRSDDVLDASENAYVLNVIFTPTNTSYLPYKTTVNVTVAKAASTASVNAIALTYGETPDSKELNTASAEMAGEWTWNDDRSDDVLDASENAYLLHVIFTPENTNYAPYETTVNVTVAKATTTLSWEDGLETNLAYNGSATYTATSASNGAITYSITNGGSYAHIDPNTGALIVDVPNKTITIQASQAEGGNYLAPDPITMNVVIAAAPVNEFIGSGDWNISSNWTNGVPTDAEPNVIVNGDLVISGVVTVGNLTIEKNSRVVLTVNGDLTVNGTSEDRTGYGNLYVENGGEVEVKGGLRVGDLTVEASIGTADGTAESGQVDKAENIVYANAYIEINMDARGTLDDTKWYGFTVPFDVDARTGISRKENGVYRQCTYGTHYMIAEYDANKRLTTGKGWKYITGNTLHAGTFYYLTVDGNYNTYRFKAKEATYTQASPATLAMNGSTSDPNANWNAVGNSTLQHAKVSFNGGNYVQVYENGLDAYRTVSASEATFVVGCPFFIQAKEESTVVLDAPTSATKYYYAPRRSSAAQGGVARVNLTSVEGGYSDQIYVSGTEKEEDAYITGRDLAKAGESKVVPQLWVDAYNQKLSVHEAVWQGENAICPLGIYAPKDGEYILTATQPENGTQVYLTIDGMPVWNISEADYVLSLEKGTMNNYGLMLVQAFKLPTDVENVEAADGEKTQKIILNDHLYILRDSRMYDVTGKKVK